MVTQHVPTGFQFSMCNEVQVPQHLNTHNLTHIQTPWHRDIILFVFDVGE